MSTTLTYGYIKPQTGDKGEVWFPAMETNIQKLNDHTHNGVDSALVVTTLAVAIAAAASGGWVALGSGSFYKTITMPGTLVWATTPVTFRKDGATDETLFLKSENVTANTFKVFANDNTLDLVVLYSA